MDVDVEQGGFTNAYGFGCGYYTQVDGECENWDTRNFDASELCCACDGGRWEERSKQFGSCH